MWLWGDHVCLQLFLPLIELEIMWSSTASPQCQAACWNCCVALCRGEHHGDGCLCYISYILYLYLGHIMKMIACVKLCYRVSFYWNIWTLRITSYGGIGRDKTILVPWAKCGQKWHLWYLTLLPPLAISWITLQPQKPAKSPEKTLFFFVNNVTLVWHCHKKTR